MMPTKVMSWLAMAIRKRLKSNSPEVRKTAGVQPRLPKRKKVKLKTRPKKKIGGLRGLYYHYCYLLGYYPKRKRKQKFYQISPMLRDELMKLNYISQEIRLLQQYQIDTMEQLLLLEESLAARVTQTKKEAKQLPVEMQAKRKAEIKKYTQQLRTCRNIAKRSTQIDEKLRQPDRKEKCMDREEEKRR